MSAQLIIHILEFSIACIYIVLIWPVYEGEDYTSMELDNETKNQFPTETIGFGKYSMVCIHAIYIFYFSCFTWLYRLLTYFFPKWHLLIFSDY